MINLDPKFSDELAGIHEASSLLAIARKRLADAQNEGLEHEIKLQLAMVEGAEHLLTNAFERLGRAIFDEYQRITGEYPQVSG